MEVASASSPSLSSVPPRSCSMSADSSTNSLATLPVRMPLLAPKLYWAPVFVFRAATDTPPAGSWVASLRTAASTVARGARLGFFGAGDDLRVGGRVLDAGA